MTVVSLTLFYAIKHIFFLITKSQHLGHSNNVQFVICLVVLLGLNYLVRLISTVGDFRLVFICKFMINTIVEILVIEFLVCSVDFSYLNVVVNDTPIHKQLSDFWII